MPNNTATCSLRIAYTDADAKAQQAVDEIIATYAAGAMAVGGIDIPDTAASATEYAIDFGSVASCTLLSVKNLAGADVHVKLNGAPGYVTGTLVGGTKTMALASVTGEHLSAELVASHGTAGILSVRRSSGNVIVESWLAGTGLQASDISDVKVWQGGSPQLFRLATGGGILIAMPLAPGASPIASASIVLTATQSGAGRISTKVFGDPV